MVQGRDRQNTFILAIVEASQIIKELSRDWANFKSDDTVTLTLFKLARAYGRLQYGFQIFLPWRQVNPQTKDRY